MTCQEISVATFQEVTDTPMRPIFLYPLDDAFNSFSCDWMLPRTSIEDEIMTVAENQLGIAWTRSLTTVFQLEVRGAWETQFWMNSTLSNDTYGIGSNLALTGPTLAVELRY